MKPFLFLPLLALFFFSSSCSLVSVAPEASHITIYPELKPAELEGYTQVGKVTCGDLGKKSFSESNLINCRSGLRNEAAKLGADLVVINKVNQNVKHCVKCVAIEATAYRANSKATR